MNNFNDFLSTFNSVGFEDYLIFTDGSRHLLVKKINILAVKWTEDNEVLIFFQGANGKIEEFLGVLNA